MKPLSIAAVLTAALGLGSTMALAQTGPGAGSGQTPPSPYGVTGGAAHLSDGSDPSYLKTKHELSTEPGYSIGTGDAAKKAPVQNDNK